MDNFGYTTNTNSFKNFKTNVSQEILSNRNNSMSQEVYVTHKKENKLYDNNDQDNIESIADEDKEVVHKEIDQLFDRYSHRNVENSIKDNSLNQDNSKRKESKESKENNLNDNDIHEELQKFRKEQVQKIYDLQIKNNKIEQSLINKIKLLEDDNQYDENTHKIEELHSELKDMKETNKNTIDEMKR